MKDDGRLKSLGILLAMIAVIVAFFAMFQRRPEEPLFAPAERPVPRSARTPVASANSASTPLTQSASAGSTASPAESATVGSKEPPNR